MKQASTIKYTVLLAGLLLTNGASLSEAAAGPSDRSAPNVVTARAEDPELWDMVERAIADEAGDGRLSHIIVQRFERKPTVIAVLYSPTHQRSATLIKRRRAWKVVYWSDEEPLPPDYERKDCPVGQLASLTGECVTPPILAHRVTPVHPIPATSGEARRALVVLRCVITVDGSVRDVEILSCSRPGKGFERAAESAVLLWRYVPALVDGKPVELYTTINVSFE